MIKQKVCGSCSIERLWKMQVKTGMPLKCFFLLNDYWSDQVLTSYWPKSLKFLPIQRWVPRLYDFVQTQQNYSTFNNVGRKWNACDTCATIRFYYKFHSADSEVCCACFLCNYTVLIQVSLCWWLGLLLVFPVHRIWYVFVTFAQ